MFGQGRRTTGIISGAAGRVSPYVDRLAHDDRFRRRLAAAIRSEVAGRHRARRRRTGVLGAAARIGSNPALTAPVLEAVSQFQRARGRLRKTDSHKRRNSMLALAGAGIIVAAVPKFRSGLVNTLRGEGSDDAGSDLDGSGPEE